MIKLTKYLKPFLGIIILTIILLFLQAICDLSLPDYMSNIVNKGIQQDGIENSIPKAIRVGEMNKVLLFTNDEDKSQIIANYKLINKDSENFNKYINNYPILNEEPIYLLNKLTKNETEKINPILGKAILTVYSIENLEISNKDKDLSFNGVTIPPNTDVFDLLSQMPLNQRLKISENINEKFSTLGNDMVNQTAAIPIRAEYVAIGMNINKIQSNYIIKIGMYMLILSLISAVAVITVGFLASKTGAGVARNLREDIFTKIESFSSLEFEQFSTASLITRTTNDITQIQTVVVLMMRMVIYAPIMGIGGIIKALNKSISMSWIIAIAVILLLLLIISVFSIALPKFKAIQKIVDKLNLIIRENLSGIMVIRAFNTQKIEEDRFDKANKELTDTNLFVNRVMMVMLPAMTLIMNGISLLIVWVGAYKIESSSMQVGDMMAFMQYAIQIIFAFLMLSIMFIIIPRASVSANRISEVLEIEPKILDPKDFKIFNNIKGILEFKNVSFRYPGSEEDMLKDINFKAMPGKTTAFIGATGSGKTTLVNLIPRFYDVTEGEILIDNVNIKDVTQHELREKIGYVPQKSFLFKGTIKSNLEYGNKEATEKQLQEASTISQSMDFINIKKEGFESAVSQGGSNLSGGQKQRLSIARAIVKKPKIYILDDSFSALDFKTDSLLRKAIKEKIHSSTMIIIAQRISTIKNADQIIVLSEGKIAGKGTHEDLIKNCEEYKEIAMSQLSKEELA